MVLSLGEFLRSVRYRPVPRLANPLVVTECEDNGIMLGPPAIGQSVVFAGGIAVDLCNKSWSGSRVPFRCVCIGR